MKKKPYYGYPLSHVLSRFLILLVIILLIFTAFIFDIIIVSYIPIIIFFSLFYIYFFVISYKKNFLKNRQNLLKRFIKIANLKGNESIVDLGTGSGFLAIGFAKYLKNGKAYGLDKFSLKNDGLKTQIISMIKINFFGNTLKNAKKNAVIENVEKRCEFIQTDITKPFYFPDKYFDIIVSSQFFYCISNKKRLGIFKEINRVLKKDGKIIFFESKSFMDWDINEIKKYFENIGYNIALFPDENFKKCLILVGHKNK
jgi:ubiquinone/menaquinone biosynthesis C-methylase UbiE